jgi:hypothetical protein
MCMKRDIIIVAPHLPFFPLTFSPYGVYTVLEGGAGNVVERHDINVSTGATTTTYCQYGQRGNVAPVSGSAGKVLRSTSATPAATSRRSTRAPVNGASPGPDAGANGGMEAAGQ